MIQKTRQNGWYDNMLSIGSLKLSNDFDKLNAYVHTTLQKADITQSRIKPEISTH